MIEKIRNKLFSPIDIYSLVFIRITFGVIMFYDIAKYFYYDVIDYYFLKPEFLFKYYGFEWIEPLSPILLHLLFLILAMLAIFIALGLFYRASIILFLIGFTYIFLLEKALYLNHYYMVIIFNFLLCFMPAHRYFSIDAAYLNPKIKTTIISAWPAILLRIQLEIILIYAGIVKINSDWLQGYPLKIWFSEHGAFFSNHYVALAGSYGVIILHLVGAPLLLFKRTRFWVFLIYAIFHSINSYMYRIGIFPWMTLALTTIFFEPNWPKKFFTLKNHVGAYCIRPQAQNLILILITIWCAFQILFPLRKYFYEGNPAWHQQGHYFSWQMKLNHIESAITVKAKDNVTNEFLNLATSTNHYLTDRQKTAIGCRPDMILQYAKFLEKTLAKETGHDISIYMSVLCSLNGRKPAEFVDTNIDLAKEKEDFSMPKWILPLDKNSRVGENIKNSL